MSAPDHRTAVPHPTLADCACFNARSAARAITDLYDEILGPSGLRMTQAAMLGAVAARSGAAMQELAAELGLDPSTMTRTLRPLEEAGLVQSRTAEDKRAKELVLTARGRTVLSKCDHLWSRAQQELRERLGPQVFDRLLADLTSVNNALRDRRSKEPSR